MSSAIFNTIVLYESMAFYETLDIEGECVGMVCICCIFILFPLL